MSEHFGSVVATFPDLESANKALRNLRDAQQHKGLEIRRGAVVVGAADGVLTVTDMEDVGLGDVASNAVDLMMFLGIGSLKIAAEAALSGSALLLSGARRAAALGGSLLVLPVKMALSVFEAERAGDYLETPIGPGVCAVVAVVDEAADRAQVIAELAEFGGEVIEIHLAANDTNNPQQ